MSNLHVVFGSGQIGTRIATRLLAAGERVRVVSRHPAPPAGAEAVAGDARELAFAADAARGARVVYDTMNPLYHHWKRDLLALGRGSLHAAQTSGARLVALDCLYMYGAAEGPMREDSPVRPVARKGVQRAELAEIRLDAVRRGAAHVAIARASDFFGPDLPASWWSERFFTRVLAGKPAECLGDPDQPHSYTYADDVAHAIVALGQAPDDVDGVWHVPTLPAESTRQLAQRVGRALGLEVAMAPLSPFVLRAVGLFAPFLRELPEMAYQWQQPFVIDDAKFRARFGMTPTPIDAQVAATIAWARQRWPMPGLPRAA
ncbi:MAG TPA: NAD-dependent epimerase/dehydratase family protein [Kofleriaceae bacterium]|nr:NAD-dependent epimerase/dehydratase family protein [Kofleriaceae bacterium]